MTTPPAYIMNTWYDQYGNTVSYGHNTTVKLSYRTKNFSDIRVGGLRIREIIDRDKKNEYKTLYEYTADGNYPSGHTLNIPEYKEYIIGTQAGGTKPYYGYRISSNPVFSVTKTQGNVVGYSNVSKYIISDGTKIKEEFGYSFKKSNRDGYLKEYYSEMEPRTWQSGKLLYSKKYKNDQLLEEEIFDYHGMDNETDKGYTEEINTSLIARGYDRIGFDDSKYSIEPDRRFDNPIVMNNVNLLTSLYGFDNFSAVYAERVGTNLNYNAWVSPMAKIPYFKSYTGFDKIRSKTTRNYDGGIPIIQQENYFYESVPTSLALSKTEIITSNDEVLTTKFLYPSDLISEPFMSQLVLDNRISTPIITQKFKNNNKTYEEKTIYTKDESSGNILLPKYFYQANFPNNNVAIPLIGNLEKTLSYDKYNAFGNILQYHFESGMYVTFLYSYNNQYPIAEIKNADFETVCSVLGGRAAVDDFSASNPTDQQIRAWTKLLRDSELLRNSQVMTYTYKPLVGMTSMTDAKGMTTYYEYDGFQRLRLVRDHRQNIVKTYCYGYAGQPVSCEEAAKTYRSASRSQAFTRNNCPSGQAGSTVTYTVPEGAYSATSQASADALAAADIAANGQNYANAQGQCLATFSLGYSVPSGRSFLLELRNVSTGQYYSYFISNNGSYAITGLPQGTYSVSVNESNYQGRYMFYLGGKSMAGTRVGFPEMAFTSYQYLYVTPY